MTTLQHYSVGAADIFRITEHVAHLPTAQLFPDHQDEFSQVGLPNTLSVSIHSWIVRMPQRLIVIDTGIGNDRDRGGNPFFDHLHTDFERCLEAAGVARDAVDTVLVTHLHIDHVGWNTRRNGDRWEPMFPRARHVFPAAELRQWQHDPKRRTIYADSIAPILDAGLAEVVEASDRAALGDGLVHFSTPGHSLEHASIALVSKGEYALFGGDVMHHPVQVERPHWNSTFCEDKPMAEASRRRALDWCATHGALYFSSHFADTSAGYVQRLDEHPQGYAWRFA